MKFLLLITLPLLLLLLLFTKTANSALNSVWSFKCDHGYCRKQAITPENEATALSLSACQLLCVDNAAIWPKPTGEITLGKDLTKININSIDIVSVSTTESPISNLIASASKIFKQHITSLVPRKRNSPTGGSSLVVNLIIANKNKKQLTLDTKEGYKLQVSGANDGRVNATITGDNFFGIRNGLETLNQLIIYDDLRHEIKIARDVKITDDPVYAHRGILLDTSRNYISVDAIKRTLDGMGASKLNTFHWHITDSQSFPYVSKSRPDLSKYGAYSTDKIYSAEDVADIVAYGLARGVKVIPEFDAPAHVGEGWQNTGLVTCFNKQPWQDYCVEPPCGQFDPTKTELYDVLEDIYGDMLEQFQPDIFHMGGDEVHFNCWNTTESIVSWMKEKGWGREEADFIKLWDYFQSEALARLYKKAGSEIPAIMWTSSLTHKEYLTSYLPKEKYIIQIWTTGTDEQIRYLLDNGYRVILSNYDALYLDCGFAGWVTDGNNWCSPYKGWQAVYENKPNKIAGDKKSQVLGAESTLWTEQADTSSVDGRLWPRASAMAEVLWSEPETSWKEAEQRMLIQRERLVELGIDADALEPEWCRHNEGSCPIGGEFNKG